MRKFCVLLFPCLCMFLTSVSNWDYTKWQTKVHRRFSRASPLAFHNLDEPTHYVIRFVGSSQIPTKFRTIS